MSINKLRKMSMALSEDIYNKDKVLKEVDVHFQNILDNCITEKGIDDNSIYFNEMGKIFKLINNKFNLRLMMGIVPISKQKNPTRIMYGKVTSDDIKRAESSIREIFLGNKTGFHYIKMTRIHILVEEAGLVSMKYPSMYGFSQESSFTGSDLTALLLSAIGEFVFLPFTLNRSKKEPEVYKLEINGQNPITVNLNDKMIENNTKKALFILLSTMLVSVPLFIPSYIFYTSVTSDNTSLQNTKDSNSLPIMYGYSGELLNLYKVFAKKEKKSWKSKVWNLIAFGGDSKMDIIYNDTLSKVKKEMKNPNNTKVQKMILRQILDNEKE